MTDAGQFETDMMIARMDLRAQEIYREAAAETEQKLNDYFARFKVKDQIKREALNRGEITDAEYRYWRTGQLAIGERWKEMRDTLATDLHNTNNLARSMVNGYMPEVYALNHNYATFQVEKASLLDTSYTLYDRQTVERLIRQNPQLLASPGKRKLAEIAAGKDKRWQYKQLQSAITKSILMGDSIPNMAKRMARELSVKNYKSAVRYARTAATSAQNGGRVDAYKRAEAMGIDLEQEWLATLDGRTRDAHRYLDGEHVPVGQPFKVDGESIRFPGDPWAPGYLIWNCRCTLVPRLKGLDQSNAPRNSKLGDMSYEEWKEGHKPDTLTNPDVAFSGIRGVLGDDYVNAMETLLNFTPHEDAKNLFYKYQDKLKVADANLGNSGAYFDPVDGVHMNKDTIQQGDGYHLPYQTAFHEFGHNIDFVAEDTMDYYTRRYKNGLLRQAIGDDYRNFKIDWMSKNPVYGFGPNGMQNLSAIGRNDLLEKLTTGKATFDDIMKECGTELAKEALKDASYSRFMNDTLINTIKNEGLPMHAIGSISDAIEGVLCSSSDIYEAQGYPLGVGHGKDYWKNPGMQELEFFAETLDGMIANPDSYAQMKRIFPTATSIVGDIIKEMLK